MGAPRVRCARTRSGAAARRACDSRRVTLVHWDDVQGFSIPDDVRPLAGRWQRLADAAGSLNVGVHRVLLREGELLTPPHVHSAEEEIFFVIGGRATLWQDGTTAELKAGDTIVFAPAGPTHTIVGGDCELLVFGTRMTPESGFLPRTNAAWLGQRAVTVNDKHPWEEEAKLGLPDGEPGERPPNVVSLEELEGDFGGIVKHPARHCGAKRSGLNWIALPPNGEGAPPHCHSAEEEVFVILDGEGTLELWGPPNPDAPLQTEPQETHPVRQGHVIARPPGTRISHCLRTSESQMTYVAYGTREPSDICYYPRSNKVFFRGLGVIGRLDLLRYGDGEPS
jgi:uncharacterized cupin superfamily protein